MGLASAVSTCSARAVPVDRRLARRDVVRRQAEVHRAGHHRVRPVEGCQPGGGGDVEALIGSVEVVVPVADMQPERDVFSVRQLLQSIKGKEQDPGERKLERLDHVVVRTDREALTGQERACGTHFIESVTSNYSIRLQRCHRHRAGPDLAPVAVAGRRADGGGGVRHVDGHRVGVGAVDRAVVHLEGEGRIGGAVRIARGREGEHVVSVDLGLRDDVVRRNRRAGAVERQRAQRRHGHDLHARQRVAGVRVEEAEVVRREGVRPVLAPSSPSCWPPSARCWWWRRWSRW